jgi:hypothetical protein
MQINEIIEIFNSEFSPIADKFIINVYPVEEAQNTNNTDVINPGVYVWWHPVHSVLRVGVSMINARKRAASHIKGNTGGVLEALAKDESTIIILFNVKNKDSSHWAIALEKYFEKKLNPSIPPGRFG